MALEIMSNRKNASAVLHMSGIGSNTLVVAGNSTVSDIAIDNEVLSGVSITQAVWGCDPAGVITIKRGANLVAAYDSTGQHEYAGCGMSIIKDAGADLTVEITGSANCFIMFEVQKQGVFISEYLHA